MPAPPRSVLGLGANAYYHFTLARAAALLGVRDLDGVNWYAAGVEWLVRSQRADGAWVDQARLAPGVLETAWNLGFLAQATLPAMPAGDQERK